MIFNGKSARGGAIFLTMIQRLLQDRFRLLLLVLLVGLGLWQLRPVNESPDKPVPAPTAGQQPVIDVYIHPDCPHCREAQQFLDAASRKRGDFTVAYYDITHAKDRAAMRLQGRMLRIPDHLLGTPLIVLGADYTVGFDRPETTGRMILSWLDKTGPPETKPPPVPERLDLPVLGRVDVFDVSLPVLAVVLGLVDGFNPCAMWVLVYLISLIAGLQDRRRIYLLISTFLVASGVLYFLFMTAWLNVFLLIGYVRWVTLVIGLAAIYMGAVNIRDYVAAGGKVVCPVGDIDARQETRGRIRRLVMAPLTWTTFAGIVVLAFAVNSVEFMCSSALPAVFTHVLSVSGLPGVLQYGYILLYVLFFMLDDMVIFLCAALALERFAGEKYAGYCHVIGGAVLVVLGVALVIEPGWLSRAG